MALIRRHIVAFYFVLTFIISWGVWFGHARAGLGLSGLGGLVGILGAFGPTLAGLVCTGLLEGWPGVKSLLKRIVAWRVSAWAYLAVFLGPILLSAVPLQLNAILGGPTPAWGRFSLLPSLLPTFAFMLLIGGLTEEPGWRGFALPHLRQKHGGLAASLILGILWGVWHIPIYSLQSLGSPLHPEDLFRFVMTTPLLAILFTALAERTRDSVWMAILFHAWNNTVGFSGLADLLSVRGSAQLDTLNLLVWILVDAGFVWLWLRPARAPRATSGLV